MHTAQKVGQAAGYEQLFSQRGRAYDAAMRAVPGARAQEFAEAVCRARLQPGMRVADVPAGGGYLQAYLPVDCEWLGHEPCGNFSNPDDSLAHALLPLPWADACVDVAISIAGVHHVHDKRALFRELWRVVRPGGRLVIADVWHTSPIATFLDGFVGAHNSTGHHGFYLDEATATELCEAGWQVLAMEHTALHWHFASEAEMTAFCSRMFDLRTAAPAEVLAALQAGPGVAVHADGVALRWELSYCTAVRPGFEQACSRC